MDTNTRKKLVKIIMTLSTRERLHLIELLREGEIEMSKNRAKVKFPQDYTLHQYQGNWKDIY